MVKSDTRVGGEGVNFDDAAQPGVLAEKLAKRLLEETDAFIFRKRKGPIRARGGLSRPRSRKSASAAKHWRMDLEPKRRLLGSDVSFSANYQAPARARFRMWDKGLNLSIRN